MTASTKVEILLFAGARELVGAPSVTVELQFPCTVAQLKKALVQSRSDLESYVKHGRIAFNQDFVGDECCLDTTVQSSTIALIPPVSGG